MTTPTSPTATQAIQEARQALQRGDKRAVRLWAERALAQDARLEEPWLLLAAASTPRASLEYLQHALSLNPGSQRAQKGLEWARQRLRAETPQNRPAAAVTQPVKVAEPVRVAQQPARPARASLTGEKALLPLALFLLLGLLSAAFLLGGATPALAFIKDLAGKGLAGSPQPARVTAAEAAIAAAYTPQAASLAASVSESFVSQAPTSAPSSPATETLTPPTLAEPTPTPLPTDTLPAAPPIQPALEQAVPEYTGQKRIIVDLSEQHMYVYENETLVYSFVVSTGMNGGTRVGTFYIQNKIPNAYGSTWDLWMPNWMGIYWSGPLQNGIHALPILSNGQRLWAGYLGTPISYGCVVLGVYEAELLYEWADIGTPVIIQY